MNEQELVLCEKTAIRLAIEAGNMMHNRSGRHGVVEQKLNALDLVTESDRAVEQFLFTELKRIFPLHKFIGEESSSAQNNDKVGLSADPTWIVDPIDGTMNFIHTFPFVCVSIALTVDRNPVLGVIYSPFLSKLYTARTGRGAYCNGRPISVRQNCQSLSEALVICGVLTTRSNSEKSQTVRRIAETVGWRSHGIRCLGSAALELCLVAEGCADAYWHYRLQLWDMAAGVLILTEAGGTVTDILGGPFDLMQLRILVASSPQLATELSDIIEENIGNIK